MRHRKEEIAECVAIVAISCARLDECQTMIGIAETTLDSLLSAYSNEARPLKEENSDEPRSIVPRAISLLYALRARNPLFAESSVRSGISDTTKPYRRLPGQGLCPDHRP